MPIYVATLCRGMFEIQNLAGISQTKDVPQEQVQFKAQEISKYVWASWVIPWLWGMGVQLLEFMDANAQWDVQRTDVIQPPSNTLLSR